MRRKYILTAAGLTATLVALAACSGGSGGGDGATGGDAGTAGGQECDSLHVAEIIVNSDPEGQRAWQQDIATRFEDETGTAIEFETMGSAADEQTKIQTSVVSNQGPDVFTMGTTFVPVAYSTGAFPPLSEEEWEVIGGQDRFFEESLGISGPSEDEYMAVPFVMRPFGLVYNTEMFEQAGLDGPPQTWDQFIEYGEKLTDPEAGVYGSAIGYSDGFDPWKYIWMWTLQNGGSLISEDLTTAQLDSDEVVTAVTQYFDLLTEHDFLNPASVSMEGPQVQAAFAQGEIAMAAMSTPTWVPALEAGSVAGKYAFAPHPTVPFGETELPEDGVPAGTILSGDNIAITSYSECRGSALKYIEFVTRPEEQKNYYETFGSIPANQEAAEELAANDPTVQAFVDATGDSVATQFTGGWANVQLGLTNVVTQSLPALAKGTYDESQVRALLAEANAAVQRDLDRQQTAR